jgi:hypothetical protein
MLALVFVAAVLAAGCGGDDDAADDPEVTTTTAPEDETPGADVPGLPSPLPEVEDPGTIDPLLGDFPVSQSRDIQFAWVRLAANGRTFTSNLRVADDFFKDFNEDEIYLDGVIVCTALAQNDAPAEVVTAIGETYNTESSPLTEEEVQIVGDAVSSQAVTDLCPELDVLFDDPDFIIPTPIALRSILGLDESDLDDAGANQFANYVCEELNRGDTVSRLVSDIADGLDYPDDLSEDLVLYVQDYAC